MTEAEVGDIVGKRTLPPRISKTQNQVGKRTSLLTLPLPPGPEFKFYPPDHSVVRAHYENGCVPFETVDSDDGGFYSGPQILSGITDDVSSPSRRPQRCIVWARCLLASSPRPFASRLTTRTRYSTTVVLRGLV